MVEGPNVPGYEDPTVLGRGGFATVYRARQTAVGRDVALKVLDGASTDPRSIELFTRECRAVGSLSWHPHVVPVYDAGRTPDGLAYLAMELLPGGSLDDRLREEGPLPLAEALRHAADVADALDAAHEVGVLHRDVKPANVLVDRRGRARLADFGIARVAGAQTTTDGAVTGTIAYLAPEVLGGGRATAASDVWALGLTLAALITGHNPLVADTDDTPFAVIARIVTGPTQTVPDGLPEPVALAIAACTARDPDQRPTAAQAHELLSALADAAAAGALHVPEAATRRSTGPLVPDDATTRVDTRRDPILDAVPPHDPAARTRTAIVVAAVLAVVLVVGVVAAVALLGGGDDPDDADGGPAPDTAPSTTIPDADGAPGDLPVLEPGALTVCAPGGTRPFSYQEDGEMTGFDVDLLSAMAATQDLELRFADAVAQLESPGQGLCDVAAGGWTITEERERDVDFTAPYLDVDQSLLVRTDSGIGPTDDVADLTVGVVSGTTGEGYATDELGISGPVGFPDQEELVAAVAARQVDAAVHDEPVLAAAAADEEGLEIVATYPTGEELGFVLADDSELTAVLDAALAETRDDGTYDEIRTGYFG